MKSGIETASLILAAGRGSRMQEFSGNKTLLPLLPDQSPYSGSRPILLQILKSLPSGPKAVVVNHRKEEIIQATRGLGLTYYEQPQFNGTGGALLAASKFLEIPDYEFLIITMGDVPLVKTHTYLDLVTTLKQNNFAVLGFRPECKQQYGVLEIRNNKVHRIIEWKYWKDYSENMQEAFQICNSGIYAARKNDLLQYLTVLESRPHKVYKKVDGKPIQLKEFFITDLVEYMHKDGLSVGYAMAEEDEVMGVDDLASLVKAQRIFQEQNFDLMRL